MPTLPPLQVSTGIAHRCRVSALVIVGALLVHKLRYVVAPGPQSAEHAATHGHAYLDFTGPLLVGILGLALASWIFSLRRDWDQGDDRPAMLVSWARLSIALIALFCLQETAEGLHVAHHPQLIDGIFGSGGWIALPLSLIVGMGIALAMRGARAARAAFARAAQRMVPDRRHRVRVRRPAGFVRCRRTRVLAGKLAGRAPPLGA